MTKSSFHIAVAGGGLVGSLMALYLARRGYRVTVLERRPDMRKEIIDGGRSINLALSARGILALEEVGLAHRITRIAIPMHGRMMHDIEGRLTFQRYGKEGQFINSVSRTDLNTLLIDEAEKSGAEFLFSCRCTHIDLRNTQITFATASNTTNTSRFDVILGADGAFSAVRSAMQYTDRFNFSQHYIEHGYKELHIPPGANNSFQLEKNALHIWPRESFMMIALPNPDGSFTCTLFLPFEGPNSFNSITNEKELKTFFQTSFPDAVPLMPSLSDDYWQNSTSSLVTMRCFPWVRSNTLLIGDAAHAIVPFYGQGMNAGFEDCRILNNLLDHYNDQWREVLPAFQSERKPDAEAIADLAHENFVEMRDLVADRSFLLRKKIEARLHELYPDQWIPQYTMVTFSPHIPYVNARATGQKQKLIMDRVMKSVDVETQWENLDFASIVAQLES